MRRLRCEDVFKAFLLLAVPIAFCASALGANVVVWQIGKFDKSTLEYPQRTPILKQSGDPTPSDVLYVIGKNQTEDWPCFQPGSSNGLAGYRAHPYAVEFDLPSNPVGLYTLKVSLLVKTPRVSRLQIAINSHRALYFQHPVLDYDRGDDEGAYMPNYSADTITAELPTQFLHQGTNELILTAVDDLPARDDVTDSGLYYDALELERDSQAHYSQKGPSVNVQPTIFFVQKGSGLHGRKQRSLRAASDVRR